MRGLVGITIITSKTQRRGVATVKGLNGPKKNKKPTEAIILTVVTSLTLDIHFFPKRLKELLIESLLP